MTVDCEDAGIKYELSDFFTFKVPVQSSCLHFVIRCGMVRYDYSTCGLVNCT